MLTSSPHWQDADVSATSLIGLSLRLDEVMSGRHFLSILQIFIEHLLYAHATLVCRDLPGIG